MSPLIGVLLTLPIQKQMTMEIKDLYTKTTKQIREALKDLRGDHALYNQLHRFAAVEKLTENIDYEILSGVTHGMEVKFSTPELTKKYIEFAYKGRDLDAALGNKGEWVPIKGYKKYLINKEGEIMSQHYKPKATYITENNSAQVTLQRNREDKLDSATVQSLMARTFLKKFKNDRTTVIRHKNGDTLDNRLANLEVIHRRFQEYDTTTYIKVKYKKDGTPRYFASLRVDGKMTTSKRCDTREEAIMLRDRMLGII